MALVLGGTLVASSVQAVGLYLYEDGTADLGLAAAGRAALAQDASTVMGNPAGMTRLERSQLTGSLYTITKNKVGRAVEATEHAQKGGAYVARSSPIVLITSCSEKLNPQSFPFFVQR